MNALNVGNGFQTPVLYLRRAVGTLATNIVSGDLSLGGTPQNGIVVENDSQGNQFVNVLLEKPVIGLLVQQGSGVVATPSFTVATAFSVDQPQTNAISQTGGNYNSYNGGKLTSSGSVTTIPAISIAGSTYTSIINYTIHGFSGSGGAAISLGATTDKVLISENILDTNTTIINFAAAATNVSIINNNFSTFSNAFLGTITGAGNNFQNNNGYNPVGTTAAASTGTTGATITAGPSPETHYIKQSANFNAAVTKNTQAICTVPSAAAPCVIQLGPNETYSVAWSTTQPTYTKDVH